VVVPFVTEGEEGLDVNEEFDWWRAERLLSDGAVRLPEVAVGPWKSNI
jgi:hypothetical protein